MTSVPEPVRLRVIAASPFVLESTSSEWSEAARSESIATRLGVWYADLLPEGVERFRFRLREMDAAAVAPQEHMIRIIAPAPLTRLVAAAGLNH